MAYMGFLCSKRDLYTWFPHLFTDYDKTNMDSSCNLSCNGENNQNHVRFESSTRHFRAKRVQSVNAGLTLPQGYI
ncbi:hypothetical protein CRENBAI_026327 [Crenichthys baileyi]|uniref:Uncharacterized protein n=1 Tax=Crenichthys baileyi TaxID=28760 RepID=A0AAV9R6D7_9TELE